MRLNSQRLAAEVKLRQPEATDQPANPPATRSTAARTVATWIANHELWLLALAVPLLMSTNRLPPVAVWLALGLIAVGWSARRVAFGYLSIPTPIDFPVAIFLLIATGGVLLSVAPHTSLIGLHKIIALVALFYGIVNSLHTRPDIRRFTLLFLLAGIAASVASLIVMARPQVKLPYVTNLYDALPVIAPRTVHANYIAGTIVPFLPLSGALFFFGSEIAPRYASGPAALLVAATLVVTESRTALLAAAVSLVLVGAWATRWFLALLPALGGTVWWLLQRANLNILVGSTADFVSELHLRQEIWQRGLHIIQDFSFTGISMGTFDAVIEVVHPFTSGRAGMGELPRKVFHAHNVYLQTAIEFGLPGFIAYMAMLVALLAAGWTVFRDPSVTRGNRGLALGLLTAVTGHLVFGLTDAIVIANKSTTFVWAALGLLCALKRIAPHSVKLNSHATE